MTRVVPFPGAVSIVIEPSRRATRSRMLGANTESYRHAHQYVESFINHDACVDLTNLFYYGSADLTVQPSEVENKALAKKLNIGDPAALEGEGVNIQSWMPNEDEVALAWEEVSAA